MADCHLMAVDCFHSIKQLILKKTETITEAREYALFICRCKDCDCPYLCVSIEPRSNQSTLCYNYWVPISDDEIAEIRENPQLAKNLMKTRKHLIWDSAGDISWNEGKWQILDQVF
jgi:hypothetical protein